MKCPRCGLINPPEAQFCDCGYSFEGFGKRMTLIEQADDSLKHRPRFDDEALRDVERLKGIIRQTALYYRLPAEKILEDLAHRRGEDLGLSALALEAVLSERIEASRRGDRGYVEWIKLVAVRPFGSGPAVVVLTLIASAACVWAIAASSELAPPGRHYPAPLFLVPGLLAALVVLLLGGIPIYLFQKTKPHDQERQPSFGDAMLRSLGGLRSLAEQVEILQKTRSTLGYVSTECGMLLKSLGESSTGSSLTRFAESWGALAGRVKSEITELAFVQDREASSALVEGLQNVQATVSLVQTALASARSDDAVIEKIRTLDRLSRALCSEIDETRVRIQKSLS